MKSKQPHARKKLHKQKIISRAITDYSKAREEEEFSDPYHDQEERDADKLLVCDETNLAILSRLQQASLVHPLRYWDAERVLALAMARHPRLGANSPARIITRDILRCILRLLRPREHLLIFGGVHSDEHGDIGPLRSVWAFDLYTGSYVRKSDLPFDLFGMTSCVVGRHVWVFGGYHYDSAKPNSDALIYDLDNDEWSIEPNIFGDSSGCVGASCVYFNDLICVFGGHKSIDCNVGQNDVCFRVSTGEFVSLPQRSNSKTLCITKCVLVGSIVIVFAVARKCANVNTKTHQFIRPPFSGNCCNAIQMLDLSDMEKGWHALSMPTRLSGDHLESDGRFYLQDSTLVLCGGSVSVQSCTCCDPTPDINTWK
jgi:hypothetical protein